MSNPTSNFGWQMPTATDLVTDLPADFEVFGQAVDTTLVDLKGGTTGQILAKNTSTDMDFVWITNDVGDITAVTAGTGISGGGTSGAVTITNSMATAIDAKGDLIVGTGADTFSRLAVGATNGHVLTVDSAEATGLKYAAAGGGGKVLQVIYGSTVTQTANSTSTYADTTLSATITPTLATSKVLVLVSQNGVSKDIGNTGVQLKLVRGATTILTFAGTVCFTNTTTRNDAAASCGYLDSPATTSATTYKLRMLTSGGTSYMNRRASDALFGGSSTITVMEVAP